MSTTKKSTDLVIRPADCDPDLLAAFRQLVIEGGQANTADLGERVRRAHWLGFHFEDGELAAVAAIKRPAVSYSEKVFRRASAELLSGEFDAELGWVVTREGFQGMGIGRHLTARLLTRARGKNLFATTRTANVPMQLILRSLGFDPVGNPYSSARGSYSLQLWVRPTRSSDDSDGDR